MLEGLGPHILRRLATALREVQEGALNESLAVKLDAGRRGEAVWTLGREMTERINIQRKKVS